MKFEVIGTDGKAKMSTYDANCVYDYAQLQSLNDAGYTFRVGGTKTVTGTIKTIDEVAELYGKSKVESATSVEVSEVVQSIVNADINITEGDTYKVVFNLCKRAKKYDDVDKKEKGGFETFEAACAFLDERQRKAATYWAGGDVISNTTGEVLRTNGY